MATSYPAVIEFSKRDRKGVIKQIDYLKEQIYVCDGLCSLFDTVESGKPTLIDFRSQLTALQATYPNIDRSSIETCLLNYINERDQLISLVMTHNSFTRYRSRMATTS
jgi:hypothetical protein